MIHLIYGFLFFGAYSIIYAIFLSYVAFISGSKKPSVFAGILAFGISSIYSSVYLWVLKGDPSLVSDAFLYNEIAEEIADRVPLLKQINPFSVQYIFDIGESQGGIVYPGFYKIIGIIYTIFDFFGLENRTTQVILFVNSMSVSAIGYLFHRLLFLNGAKGSKQWILWCLLILFPYFIELVVWLRKDLILLMLSLFFVSRVLQNSNFFVIFSTISIISTFRMPQAIALFVFYVFYVYQYKNLPLSNILRSHKKSLITLAALACAVIAFVAPDIEASNESFDALYVDLQYNVGLSAIFLRNELGVAIYSILYPFPIVTPNNIFDFWRSIFSTFQIFVTIFAIVQLRNNSNIKKNKDSLFLLALMLVSMNIVTCILSWNSFGFVVFEPRYKLLPIAVFILILSFPRSSGARVRKNLQIKAKNDLHNPVF
jgi:hypothetical protein